MSPLSRGRNYGSETQSLIFGIFLLGHFILISTMTQAFTVPPTDDPKIKVINADSPDDIEAFVKRLEYQAANGGDNSLDDLGKIDFHLLSDDVIASDIQDGLQEEFEVVDMKLGDQRNPGKNATARPTSRQLSLIYQGVYAPDARFNAFADGVMVNMVAEMRRKRMDPLYFRVYDRGIIEHVAARAGREGRRDEPTAVSSVFARDSPMLREGRQNGNAIGGGVIRGLTNVKRFGNAEVQIAGNTTLVRSHYVYGPLNIELIFHTDKGVKTINSTLGALATHSVAGLNNNSSKLMDFIIDSPAEYEIRLIGAKSRRYQRISQSAILRLFKPTGRLERRMKQQFFRARSQNIPDVTATRKNENRNGNRNRESSFSNENMNNSSATTFEKGDNANTGSTTLSPELP
ncbi:hypothetical protein SK128_007469 [Halocaridina rubra]|uniref:Uncharacterized protein n=1 Tax=Halocaridina rubra TaxID=373956 RepID=A0AAN8WK95_HALRR